MRNDDYWGPKPAFKNVRIRIIPEQATQIAELVSGGVDIIKAVPPDQMDVINKSGQARTTTSPILRTAMIQLDQAGRSGANPFQDKRVRQAANLAVDIDAIIKHVLNGLGDRTATTVNPMAFGFDPNVKPYKQDLAQAKKLLADAGFPNGLEVGFLRTQPAVEPGLIQTSDAIVADLAKVGIRTKARMVGESGPFTNLIRDNKADPDVRVLVGLLLDLRRRRHLLRRDDVQPAVQLLLQQGASTTWSSRAAPRSTPSGGPRSTPRPRSSSTTTPPTSSSGACAACGASATGSTTRRPATRSTGCGP